MLLTGSYDSKLRIYNAENDYCISFTNFDNKDPILDAKFLSDNQYVASPKNSTIKLYDITKSIPISKVKTNSFGYSLSPTYNNLIVSGHHNGSIISWDIRTKAQVNEIKAHTQPCIHVISNFESSRVVSLSLDNTIIVNDLRYPQAPVGKIKIKETHISSKRSRMSVQNDIVIVGGNDGNIYSYSLNDFKKRSLFTALNGSNALNVQLSNSLNYLVTGDNNGVVKYWKAR